MISELLEETIIAVVSLSLGYAVGRYRRQATMGKPQRERLKDIGQAVIGLVIVMAVGLTVFQVQSNAARDREIAQCFLAFAADSASAIAERSAANGERDRQLVEVVDSVLGEDQELSRETLQRFRDAVAEAEAKRAARPLPAPPRCDP